MIIYVCLLFETKQNFYQKTQFLKSASKLREREKEYESEKKTFKEKAIPLFRNQHLEKTRQV